jgi:hypothetical protein
MPEKYELRQGARVLNTIEHTDDLEVELAVSRERLAEDLRSADAAADAQDEALGLGCDC